MNVDLPPDFETFAREQVKTGAFASEQDCAAYALRSWMSDIQHLKALVGAGLASVERGEGMDGEAALFSLRKL